MQKFDLAKKINENVHLQNLPVCVIRCLVIASRLKLVSFQGESYFRNENLLIHNQTISARRSSHNGEPVTFW